MPDDPKSAGQRPAEPVAGVAADVEQIPVVDVQLPLNGAEALVLAFDAAGNSIAVPARIVIQPFFPREEASALAAYLTLRVTTREDLIKPVTTDNDRQRATLRVGGKTGKLSIVDRTRRMRPSFLTK
jgi:hypothetical protein